MHEREFITPYIKFWIEDDIVFGEYLPNVQLTLEAVKTSIEARIEFTKGKPHLFLCDLTPVKSATKEARDFSSKDIGIQGITAGALIVNSSVSKIIGNFFLSINKPSAPAKLFTDKAEALKWLQQFK